MIISVYSLLIYFLGLTSCHATLASCLSETRAIFNDVELSKLWYAALQKTDYESIEIVLLADAADVDDRINIIDWGENSNSNTNLNSYQARCETLSGTYMQLDASAMCSHFDGSQDSFFEENNAPYCLGLSCSARDDFPWVIHELTTDRWLSRTELLESFTFSDSVTSSAIPDPSWWCPTAGMFKSDVDISEQFECASQTRILQDKLEAEFDALTVDVEGTTDFTGIAATTIPFQVTLDFGNTPEAFVNACSETGQDNFNETFNVRCTKSVDGVDSFSVLYTIQSWPRCIASFCNSSDFDLYQISELDMILRFEALVDDAFSPFSFFSNVDWKCYTTDVIDVSVSSEASNTTCDQSQTVDKLVCQVNELKEDNPILFWGVIAGSAFALICCCCLFIFCCFCGEKD